MKSNINLYKEEELLNNIFNPENICNAYWKLKKYHKDEDALFFDDFDYNFFEKKIANKII